VVKPLIVITYVQMIHLESTQEVIRMFLQLRGKEQITVFLRFLWLKIAQAGNNNRHEHRGPQLPCVYIGNYVPYSYYNF